MLVTTKVNKRSHSLLRVDKRFQLVANLLYIYVSVTFCITFKHFFTGHVAEVFGNVCSLSMTINGFGHDLQSTCRYQSSDSVHILPTFHSNCSSTITEREFQIYWLKPYDIDLPYDEDLVMTKQVKELFILNADTLKDNGGDNKGIFALSFRIKFMLNGTDSQTKQKVCFINFIDFVYFFIIFFS